SDFLQRSSVELNESFALIPSWADHSSSCLCAASRRKGGNSLLSSPLSLSPLLSFSLLSSPLSFSLLSSLLPSPSLLYFSLLSSPLSFSLSLSVCLSIFLVFFLSLSW